MHPLIVTPSAYGGGPVTVGTKGSCHAIAWFWPPNAEQEAIEFAEWKMGETTHCTHGGETLHFRVDQIAKAIDQNTKAVLELTHWLNANKSTSTKHGIAELARQIAREFAWIKSPEGLATKIDLKEMETRMALKVSEIKAAVAEIKKNNAEAFAELGTRIADLQKQIDDLIAGNTDPTVTDDAFESDLNDLKVSAKALADIVPGSPTP